MNSLQVWQVYDHLIEPDAWAHGGEANSEHIEAVAAKHALVHN